MIRDTFTADRVTERLGRTVRGEVLRPGDDGYDAARALALPVVDPRPLAVVRPVDAQDVAAALAVLVGEGAPIALRGGGHHPSAWAGTARSYWPCAPWTRARWTPTAARRRRGAAGRPARTRAA